MVEKTYHLAQYFGPFGAYLMGYKRVKNRMTKGIVDGSASKPTLVLNTNYMIEKIYYIAPYLDAFRAYLRSLGPKIKGSK